MSKPTRREVLNLLKNIGFSSMLLPFWMRTKAYNLPPLIENPAPDTLAPQSNLHPIVGEVEALSTNQFIVRDAEGLHNVQFDQTTEIHQALGAPTFDMAPSSTIKLQKGQVVWVAAQRSQNGRMQAIHVDVNPIVGMGAIAVTLGERFVDARLELNHHSLDFHEKSNRIWLVRAVRVLKLDSTGRFIPAQLQEMNIGQYIMFYGNRAEDQNLVATTLLLGNGKPPGIQ